MEGQFGINWLSAFLKISKLFKNHEGDSHKNCPNQTFDYWLITPKQQTLCIETNIF